MQACRQVAGAVADGQAWHIHGNAREAGRGYAAADRAAAKGGRCAAGSVESVRWGKRSPRRFRMGNGTEGTGNSDLLASDGKVPQLGGGLWTVGGSDVYSK